MASRSQDLSFLRHHRFALSRQECNYYGRDRIRMCFNCEMTGVQELNHCTRNVSLKRFGTRRQKERVVAAPYGEQRRRKVADVALKLRVHRDVISVVEEQVELNFVGSGTS